MLNWVEHEKSFITSGPGGYICFVLIGRSTSDKSRLSVDDGAIHMRLQIHSVYKTAIKKNFLFKSNSSRYYLLVNRHFTKGDQLF